MAVENTGTKKNINIWLVICLVLCIIMIIGLVFYIFYYQEDNSLIKDENNDVVLEKDNIDDVNTAKCSGTYIGDDVSFTLNSDATFTANFGGVSGTKGYFLINDNTISFVIAQDTVGPRDLDPYYRTSNYVIADDCSYINYNNGVNDIKLVSSDVVVGNGKTNGDFAKCYGTYSNSSITYELNQDGTFTFTNSSGAKDNGYFGVMDNTVSFVSMKHTVGPKEEDPYYTSIDYVMADDCSYLVYNNGTLAEQIYKK